MRSSPICESPSTSQLLSLRAAGEGFPSLVAESAALQRMRLETVEALNALPRRGLEIGGFLLGRVEAAPDAPPTVTVLDFVTVEISHQQGPSYQLSGDEIAEFRQRMDAAIEAAGNGAIALGCWRSDTLAQPLALRPEDEAVFRAVYGKGPAIYLLFRPHAFDAFPCQMLVLEDGEIYPSSEFAVSFRTPASAAQEDSVAPPVAGEGDSQPKIQPSVQADAEASFATLPAPESGSATTDSGKGESPRHRVTLVLPSARTAIAASLAGIAFLGVMAAILYGPALLRNGKGNPQASASLALPTLRPPLQAEPSSAVAELQQETIPLHAHRVADGIRLAWEDASVAQQATRGSFLIRDGNTETRIRLDTADLKAGSVTYSPRTETIRVEAAFFGDGFERRGALQVVSAELSTPERNRPVREGANARAANPIPSSAGDLAPNRRRPRAFDPPPAPAPTPGERRAMLEAAPASPVADNSPSSVGRALPSTDPSTALPPAPAESTPSRDAATAQATAPDCRVSVRTLAYYEPRSRFGFLKALGKLPLIPGGGKSKKDAPFVEAALLSQNCPDLRGFGLVHRPPSVDFLVQLNADGSLDKAEAVGPQQHTVVADQARRAMSSWRFRPARVGDTSVNSELRVTVAMVYPPLESDRAGQ
ncbi:MAG: hypothetical protein U5J83_15145 [Bryobacterales bacterium]|nr:hypothetical protein [Bryobacterales bacterium]